MSASADPIVLRVEGHDLPGASCAASPDRPQGHHGIHVAVQRRAKPAELLGLTPGDAPEAVWNLECTVIGTDVRGPYVQGPPGGRFIYLSWVIVEGSGAFTMFRRAKIRLDQIPAVILTQAVENGLLTARVGLTDAKGNPTCAAFKLGEVEWKL
ncbi:MAG: hypothetical protein NVS3B21_11340 [Acidimicrobiales bacterium]